DTDDDQEIDEVTSNYNEVVATSESILTSSDNYLSSLTFADPILTNAFPNSTDTVRTTLDNEIRNATNYSDTNPSFSSTTSNNSTFNNCLPSPPSSSSSPAQIVTILQPSCINLIDPNNPQNLFTIDKNKYLSAKQIADSSNNDGGLLHIIQMLVFSLYNEDEIEQCSVDSKIKGTRPFDVKKFRTIDSHLLALYTTRYSTYRNCSHFASDLRKRQRLLKSSKESSKNKQR
ncbi:unnamed protein product, partial [Didymodactylos carnosus]